MKKLDTTERKKEKDNESRKREALDFLERVRVIRGKKKACWGAGPIWQKYRGEL